MKKNMRRSFMRVRRYLFLLLAVLAPNAFAAGTSDEATNQLPLKPGRSLDFHVDEGTWMALDVSPDGETILFDLLGDIYALDMDGGEARPVLQGMAFETNPVFSPDGKQIAFISDRSGSSNLWVADVDGGGLKQLSHDKGATLFTAPEWGADGESVYVSRAVHSVLAFEIFKFRLDGGMAEQITKAKPSGGESFDERHNAIGAVASSDGRYLYYAMKHGTTWTPQDPPNWSIARRDLETDVEDIIIAAVGGGGMRPALSHDGRYLVYASRYEAKTGLRLRDLETGADRWLLFPIDHDGQTGGYYADILPRFAFTPDNEALIFTRNGKFQRLSIREEKQSEIPFSAHVELGLGPATRVAQTSETGPVRARVIEETKLSPDGRAVVFSALGGVYVQKLEEGASAQRISRAETDAFQPSWSPDGRRIAYVTWSAKDGGHIWSAAADGSEQRQLTKAASFYSEPVFSPDGRQLIAMRANHHERRRKLLEIMPDRLTDIIRLSADGGEVSLVAHAYGARLPQIESGGERLRFYAPGGLKSIRLDGTDLQRRISVVVQNWNQYFADRSVPVDDLRLNPRGDLALAKTGSQLYLLRMPEGKGKEPPVVDLRDTGLLLTKLTNVGADFFGWSADGKTIYWTVGSTFRRIALEDAFSLVSGEAEEKAEVFPLVVEIPRDTPQGALVLRGAMAITMNGDEVIKNADILIINNRIAAVGKRGKTDAPKDAVIRNVKGKYILPGFVDTHAHWIQVRRKVQDRGHWNFLANLAYGVTSGLDVQTFTTDAFAYQDMIDAGLMIGPRAFSTGPGVFVNSRIDSKKSALNVLKRYKDHYRTRNIKSYMVGGREQRQYLIEAAAELGVSPTTEGASDLWLNVTHAMDGFAGNEHNLPVTPLHEDVISLFAKTRISYTPTLIIAYGGPPGWDSLVIGHYDQLDEKLRRFTPQSVIVDKLRNLRWKPSEEQTYSLFARDAVKIQRAGGLVGMGSHGELQGLGYHWELQAYASGGAAPFEVLQAATIGSSEVIGRAGEIGSLEPGKFADLLILDENPLEDIRNTLSLEYVMKNGRLYDAGTLNEVWPREKPLAAPWFWDQAP